MADFQSLLHHLMKGLLLQTCTEKFACASILYCFWIPSSQYKVLYGVSSDHTNPCEVNQSYSFLRHIKPLIAMINIPNEVYCSFFLHLLQV